MINMCTTARCVIGWRMGPIACETDITVAGSVQSECMSVQKRAIKIVRQCRHLNYRQRLEFLNLPTLAFRRNRGDMIEVYTILTGKYDPTLSSILHRKKFATLIATPRANHWNSAHIVPSTIYANTTLGLGSLVSGTASQHMWSQQFQ